MIVHLKLTTGATVRSVWNSATSEQDAIELACMALPDSLKACVVRGMVEHVTPLQVQGMDSTLAAL